METAKLEELIKVVENLADKRKQGHLTLMRFTTCWKGMYGTVDLDSSEGRWQVANLAGFSTLEDLLEHLASVEGLHNLPETEY